MIERLVDAAARELNVAPDALRRRNFIKPKAMPYTTATDKIYDTGDFASHMAHAQELGRLGRLQEARRGRQEKWAAARHRHGDLYRSLRRHGRRHRDDQAGTGRRRHGADRLAIDRARPRHGLRADRRRSSWICRRSVCGWCRATPTASRPAPAPADRARSRAVAPRSTEPPRCSRRISSGSPPTRSKRAPATSRLSKARCVSSAPIASIAFADLARRAEATPDKLTASDAFEPPQPTYPNGTHVVEVEIDEATGRTDIVNYVVVDDFGVTLNPLLLAGQVHGGAVQGIGQALMEQHGLRQGFWPARHRLADGLRAAARVGDARPSHSRRATCLARAIRWV